MCQTNKRQGTVSVRAATDCGVDEKIIVAWTLIDTYVFESMLQTQTKVGSSVRMRLFFLVLLQIWPKGVFTLGALFFYDQQARFEMFEKLFSVWAKSRSVAFSAWM